MAFAPADTTAEGICNRALVHLGCRGAFVQDLSADDGDEAEIFNAVYDSVLQRCLAAFPWPFATLRRTLVQIDNVNEPARDGWEYIFALPTGCLQTRKIWPAGTNPTLADLYGRAVTADVLRNPRPDQRIPFVIEKASVDDSQVLLCDLAEPTLFYTAKVSDPTKYPALFGDALAWMLAAETAYAITGKRERERDALQMALRAIHEAQAVILNGQQEDEEPMTETLAARL